MTTYAFFDLDNTLIKPVSLVSFFIFLAKNDQVSPQQIAQFEHLKTLKAAGVDRQQLNRQYYAIYQGLSVSSLMTMGERWFKAQRPADLFHATVCERVRMHREKGHQTCIVSGSFLPCIRPIQATLCIDHVICTELEVLDNRLTGALTRQAIGPSKQERMRAFIDAVAGSSNACYAYADDISDLDMLTAVGHPVAVTSTSNALYRHAQKNDWTIIDPAAAPRTDASITE